MKEVLIVSANNSHGLISDLPYLMKKGGFRVTVVSSAHWSVTHNSFIDELIDASSKASTVIEQVAQLIRSSPKRFDVVILGSDELVWTLLDSAIEPWIKSRLYPIANLAHLKVLDGKIGMATFCKEMSILHPPFKVAHTREEAKKWALELGLPVMLKTRRSGGGEGVRKCHTIEEIEQSTLSSWPWLVEKYIEGELISVEPLFLHSHLIAYNYSLMTSSSGPFQPSLERVFKPCPTIEPLLQKLGQELHMTGFANLSFIHEPSTGRHYLFEMDFRPNKWVRYGKFVGVNWSKALNNSPGAHPEQPRKELCVRHFPRDLFYAIATKNRSGMLYWILNRNGSWRYLPFYDIKTFLGGIWYFVKKMKRKLNLCEKVFHR